MSELDTFTVQIHYGTVELQQRPVHGPKGFGFETRSVWRDLAGNVEKTGEWEPPLCWIGVSEPERRRPWWQFWA